VSGKKERAGKPGDFPVLLPEAKDKFQLFSSARVRGENTPACASSGRPHQRTNATGEGAGEPGLPGGA